MKSDRLSSFLTATGVVASILAVPRDAVAKWPAGYAPKERTWYSYGARYTHPQKGAVSFTVMRAMETDTMMVTGWFAQAEPGLGGGKVSVGFGGLSPSEQLWAPPIFGAGIKGSVLRTWGSPDDGVLPGQTFLGPEVDFTLPYLKLSAGYSWRVLGTGGPARHFTWGVAPAMELRS